MGNRVSLTTIEYGAADAAAFKTGTHEKSPDFRGVLLRIQFRRVTIGARISPKKRLTPAPTAATGQSATALHDKVRAIANQLGVDTKCAAQCALDLGGAVIVRTEHPSRECDESFELI